MVYVILRLFSFYMLIQNKVFIDLFNTCDLYSGHARVNTYKMENNFGIYATKHSE